MAGTATPRWSVGALGVLAALAALVSSQSASGASPAPRAAPNHAIVIIDDGLRRTETAISFSGEINGIEALDAAGATAILSGFGGLGAAVCSIDGFGCSASNCLTCQAPKYWHYFRADNGADTLLPSGGGASTSTVGNCDVEAWLWGNAMGPQPAPDVESICRAAPTTTATTQRPDTRPTTTDPQMAGAPSTTVQPAVVPTGPAATATTVRDAVEGTTTTIDDDGTSTTTEDDGAPSPDDDRTEEREIEGRIEQAVDEVAAPAVAPPEDSGGGAIGIAAVGAVVVGIGVWALALRRRNVA